MDGLQSAYNHFASVSFTPLACGKSYENFMDADYGKSGSGKAKAAIS
jgi:hypothetical protein